MALPVYYTGAYQKWQQGAGIPGGPGVFTALANPPATGVTAAAHSVARAQALGVIKPNAKALALRTQNRDYVRDQYDDGSILRSVPGGGPSTYIS